MLPKDRRLPAPLLVSALKKSRLFSSEYLSLRVHYLSPADQTKPAKIAIITPLKINKKAVDRHLSKRKISACLEKDLNLIKPGQYLIWQLKKDITKLDLKLLGQEIKNLLMLYLK